MHDHSHDRGAHVLHDVGDDHGGHGFRDDHGAHDVRALHD